MRKVSRLINSFYQLLLPVIVLFLVSSAVVAVALVYFSAVPPRTNYLVTPAKFAQLSSRGAKVTDENWENSDGTSSRGWLLRGNPGLPAIILLHRYGTDRSHVLNLGVKLNETTNFTVLMPDQRGHGLDPAVSQTTFGGCEVEDTQSAIKFLRSARAAEGKPLVGKEIGIYGVELGAVTGLMVAANDPSVKALALESVPRSSDDLLSSIVTTEYRAGSFITALLARGGTYIYYATGCYDRTPSCAVAKQLQDRDVILLAGPGASIFQTSTSNLSSCFPKTTDVAAYTDLTPSGFDLTNATLPQADFYDQRVIYFFKESLSAE